MPMFGRKMKKAYYVPYQDPYLLYGYHYNQGMNSQHEMRQQPFPPYDMNQQWNNYSSINPYQTPFGMMQPGNGMANPYLPYTGAYPPYPQYEGFPFNEQMNQEQGKKKKNLDSVFQNPLQEMDESFSGGSNPYFGNNFPFMNPYPKQSAFPRPPSGMQSIMNSFKTQEGNLDLNKMVDTAGQMMNAFTQVSSMVKGLGGIFKV